MQWEVCWLVISTIILPTILNPDGLNKMLKVFISAMQDTCNELASTHILEAISFSSAMHSILAVSHEGIPLTPAIIWADIRSSSLARELKNSTTGIQLHHETGTPIHPVCVN